MEFIWVPVKGGSSEYDQAVDIMPENPDPRARVWYDEDAEWRHDDYLQYDAGTGWHDGDGYPADPSVAMNHHTGEFTKESFAAVMLENLPACADGIETDG